MDDLTVPVGAPQLLVGCETSARVRDAFRRQGIDAWSADLLPCKGDPRYHIQGDVFDALDSRPWAGAILHPTCTYLTNAAEWAFGDGPYHMKLKPGTLVGAARRAARVEALHFVRQLMAYGSVMRICIENPKGAISTAIRRPEQVIQPYQFGDDASKLTCFWLDGFPPLKIDPAWRCDGRWVIAPGGNRKTAGKRVERWANQTDSGQNRLSPGADRWAERSVTYQGVADQMAAQWAPLLFADQQRQRRAA